MAGALAYRDNPRYEMIRGREQIMSPVRFRHYTVQRNLMEIFREYLKEKEQYEILSDFAVYFDKENWLEPDIFIISDRSMIKESSVDGAPDFVAEILSPTTYKRDIGVKKDMYEEFGVKEYWLIDPDSRIITTYLNQDGNFILDNVYHAYSEEDFKVMTEAEKAEIHDKIKLSMFDDLIIDLRDIFK